MSDLDIGVLALQGAVSEHVDAFHAAFASTGIAGRARPIRRPADLETVDGVALPGGESTTISKLLRAFRVQDVLARRAIEEDLPVFGTCAGMILLATEGDKQVAGTGTELLGLMDMAVDRNAFGRQRESFESEVDVRGLDAPFPAVFIRAPAATRTWGACEPIGAITRFDASTGKESRAVVAVRQGNRMGLAFHPELTPDARMHALFLEVVAAWKSR